MTDKLVERALVRFVADCSDEEQQLPALQFICNRSPFIAEAITKALAEQSYADLIDRIMVAVCDPGCIVGYKGERSLNEWQRDALQVILPPPPAPHIRASETPQFPSEREEIVKWLREVGATDKSHSWWFHIALRIERGEHLTRQGRNASLAQRGTGRRPTFGAPVMTLPNPIDEIIERLNDKASFVESIHERELEGALYRQASAALSSLQEQKRKLEEALEQIMDFGLESTNPGHAYTQARRLAAETLGKTCA